MRRNVKADEIIKVLNDLCEKFGIAIDWSSKNVLPYVQKLGERIVAYEFWTSIVWIVINLLLVVGSIVVIKKIYKWSDSEDYDCDWDGFNIFCVGICIIVALACFACMLTQVFDIVTCLVFPEKAIIESCMDIYNTYN